MLSIVMKRSRGSRGLGGKEKMHEEGGEGRDSVMLPFFPKHSHTSARSITLHPPQISTIRLFFILLIASPGSFFTAERAFILAFPLNRTNYGVAFQGASAVSGLPEFF